MSPPPSVPRCDAPPVSSYSGIEESVLVLRAAPLGSFGPRSTPVISEADQMAPVPCRLHGDATVSSSLIEVGRDFYIMQQGPGGMC